MLTLQLINIIIFLWGGYFIDVDVACTIDVKPISLNVQDQDTVNVNTLGVNGNSNQNQTKPLQEIINKYQGKTILLPAKQIFTVDSLTIWSGTTLVLNGTILKSRNSNGPLLVFQNVKNVSLKGKGIIDGNKKQQTKYRNLSGLVFIKKVSGFTMDGLQLRDNFFPRYTHTDFSGGMIYAEASENLKFSNLTVRNYAREGIWIKSSSQVNLDKIALYGGYDSWSGLQCGSGTKDIKANNITSSKAGATGINMDVTNGTLTNSRVTDNAYFHGYSFGHEGFPAKNVTVENCTYSLSQNVNKTDLSWRSANGFNVSAGSDNIRFINCLSEGAKQNGFNISNGSKYVILENCDANASNIQDVNVYGDNKTKVLILKSKFRADRIKRSPNAQLIRE